MLTRAMRGFRYVRRPVYLARRIAYEIHVWRNPSEPWLVPGAIRFLDTHLDRTMTGFEWGSGRSTAWLGARLGRLVSIEHDATWHARVQRQLERQGLTGVQCRLIPAAPSGYAGPLHYVTAILKWPDESLDFVLVDGHYRLECIPQALPKLKPGGYLAVDNTDWPYEWAVPSDWPIVHRSRSVVSETTIWQRPSAHEAPRHGQ